MTLGKLPHPSSVTEATPGAGWLPTVHELRCGGCGHCVAACPTGVLMLRPSGVPGRVVVHLARPEACTYCAECEAVCPEGAIELRYEIVLAPRALRP